MFIVEMEYWYHGMQVEDQDDYVIASAKVATLEEAEKIASEYADLAASKLEAKGEAWGYNYPGQRTSGCGRIYYIDGGGEYYEIYIQRAKESA